MASSPHRPAGSFLRRSRHLLLLATLLLSPPIQAGDMADALQAWRAQDYGRARELLSRLAEKGEARAHLLLGLSRERGLGVAADPERALEHYRRAAQAGDALAALILANRLYRGRAAPGDPAAALRWWRLAADRGLPQARYNLGLAYLRGEGTERNLAEAVMWLRLAAEAGLSEARDTLARLYEEGIGVPRDLQQAARWRAAASTPPPEPRTEPDPTPSRTATAPEEEGASEMVPEPAQDDTVNGPEWVMQRPATHYTLQLASGPDRSAIIAFLGELEGLPARAWLKSRYDSGKRVYLALLGDYPDLESARKALQALPPSLRERRPWIRNFGLLQKSQMEENETREEDPGRQDGSQADAADPR